ncbi:MAG: DUF2845 domain-containing protein [Gammaproteobacteria bacterium]|nr:DUF2845 domain-containing protein [Gammaproteobacteria bacterium]MDH4316503.1 DUF2845 domain-containing protein [Gammaproteobacteria bacterium]MDH5215134.1 DUF2845 domain-containing protein [Gammaproteobacteria bacterium]
MNRTFLPAALLLVFATAAASTDTLRCGGKIVTVGMTSAEVENYCGKPSSTAIEFQDVRAGNRVVGTTELHIWTYDRASGQNAAVLQFDQTKLLSITFVRK